MESLSDSPDGPCQPAFSVGDSVRVELDGDGAAGLVGVVAIVWPSGRCTVDFPDGSFRSLLIETLRKE